MYAPSLAASVIKESLDGIEVQFPGSPPCARNYCMTFELAFAPGRGTRPFSMHASASSKVRKSLWERG